MGKQVEEPNDPHVADPHQGARVRMERLKRLAVINPILEAAGIDRRSIEVRAYRDHISYLDVIDNEIERHGLTAECDAAAKDAGSDG